MSKVITTTLTDKRREWLLQLLAGPAKRARGAVGYDCMVLGWTEWHYVRNDNGQPIDVNDAIAAFGGDDWFNRVHNDGLEHITEKGRRRLGRAI